MPHAAPLVVTDADWGRLLAQRASGDPRLPSAGDSPYRPIAAASGPFVVAQLGQSLDGRIATAAGQSHYVNGPAALDHLHRLRALADAVVVGGATVLLDDPALTVRRCPGRHPARVVVDTQGTLPADRQVFRDDGVPTLVVTTAPQGPSGLPGHVAVVRLPAGDGAPAAVLAALGARGLRVVLVEGGARTVSAFIAAGRVDRLHLAVAPLLIGSGPRGLQLPEIARLDAALRPPCRVWQLGADTLFDCDLAAVRP